MVVCHTFQEIRALPWQRTVYADTIMTVVNAKALMDIVTSTTKKSLR